MNSRQFERNYWARALGVTDYGRRRPRVGDIQPRDGFPIREPEFLPMPPLSDPCLFWRYGLNGNGYGRDGGKLVHRLVWKQVYGSLGRSEDVLHLCHRRACFQPAHLYVGSAADNARDRRARFGGLDFRFRGSLPPGGEGIEILWRELKRDGKRVLDYGWERVEAILKGQDHAWEPDSPQGFQLELEPTEPNDCPRHNFRIPVGSFWQCTICGLLSFAYRDGIPVEKDGASVVGLFPCWYPPGGFIVQTLSASNDNETPPSKLRIFTTPPSQDDLIAAMQQYEPGDPLRPRMIASERIMMPVLPDLNGERQMVVVGSWSLSGYGPAPSIGSSSE